MCVSYAQKSNGDTSAKNLNEIVVTATRTEKSLGTIPVPIQIISKKFIQQSGSQKLIDILQMQTGLVLADNPLGQALQGYPNPFGSGIQLQGLDPAYTLILMDGEPLTGRNAGILNLGRIAVGNIQQIEIVKGPATSLYGSDALAGVINIITEKPKYNSNSVEVHHATNNTWNITSSNTIKKQHTSYQFFANRFSSSGYDLDKSIYGKTSDPYFNYSFAVKCFFELNPSTSLQSTARLFTQKQYNNYLVYPNNQPDTVDGSTRETDWGINNQLSHSFNKKVKLFTRLFVTGYQNNADVYLQKDNSLYDKAYLHQFLLKPEVQIEIGDKRNQKFIAGTGYNFETIDANRYSSEKKLNAVYVFAQKEWLLKNKLNITAGARFDKHNLYKAQFNPKIAIAYSTSRRLTLMASVGAGFKAPDFRQQFLNFSNSLIGYSLLGASELANGLTLLKQQGQISNEIDITPYLGNNTLSPEKSVGINIGVRYLSQKNTTVTGNIFRNDINNLIDRFDLPFTKINNQSIFSYKNINKVFTQGFDINIDQQILPELSVHAGYQYLDAKDKDVINKIKNRQIVKRDPVTLESSYTTMRDYGGLFNRSKHTANLQFAYTSKKNKFNISIRANYHGRFGYSDINGSGILDDDREYVKAYTMLNATVSKQLLPGLEIQIGSDNILDHTDKIKLPNLFGRTYFINCSININKILQQKK